MGALRVNMVPHFAYILNLLNFLFQGYYDNPKVCALYVMKGTLEGESLDC